MGRIFTLKNDEPVCIELRADDAVAIPAQKTESVDRDRWVVLPAETALAVAEFQGTSLLLSADGTFSPAERFTVDVDLIVYKDGTVGMLPVEAGVFGEGDPDDLSRVPALTREEAAQLHPEFADLFTIEPDPEFEEQERAWAESDRQREAMAEIERRAGRLSAAYRMQLQLTPHAVPVRDLAEIAELYDDDLLRQAINGHPDREIDADAEDDEWAKATADRFDEDAKAGAAIGLIARMLVAEAILHPGVRQSDLKGQMGITSGPQSELTYPLGKAGILHRTVEKTQVFLAPADRCGELGLDEDRATEFVAWRDVNPDLWVEIIQRATEPVRVENSDDGYAECRDERGYAHDDGSIPFGADAPSARAWPHVPDEPADNPHILRWWTPDCDETIAELIAQWRWHYPWKLTEAVAAVVGKDLIDRWAAEDPICQQYVYYNVLMNFGIARARRIGLERALPMPQTRTCRRCGADFEEDLVPMRRVRAGNAEVADNCGRCK